MRTPGPTREAVGEGRHPEVAVGKSRVTNEASHARAPDGSRARRKDSPRRRECQGVAVEFERGGSDGGREAESLLGCIVVAGVRENVPQGDDVAVIAATAAAVRGPMPPGAVSVRRDKGLGQLLPHGRGTAAEIRKR